jgi:hypothetical protein
MANEVGCWRGLLVISDVNWRVSWVPFALCAALAGTAVGGCAQQLAKLPYVGESANVPPPPAKPAPFPGVYDQPANTRASKPLTKEERAKIEAELTARRARQAQEGAAAAGYAPPPR